MGDPSKASSGTKWAQLLVSWLYAHKKKTIVALVIVGLGLGAFASRMKIDNSLQVWFLEDDPALVAYEKYKGVFGNDEAVVVAATDPTDIYTIDALTRVRAASLALEAHPKVRRVTSLALGLYADGSEGMIEVDTLLPRTGDISQANVDSLKEKIKKDPSFHGTIVGNSDQMTLIVVEPKTFENFDAERPTIVKDIKRIARESLNKDGGSAHFGGIGVVYEGLNEASMRDSTVFVTLSYLILLIGLFVLFRRWSLVLIGTVVVTIPLVATMGIAGATGRDMNMVLAILPTLIMTVGILDLVHIIDAFRDGTAKDRTPLQILRTNVAVVIIPCIVNTITDVVGFASFTSAKMSAIRDLGWLAAIGLFLLLITVLVIGLPAIARFGGTTAKSPGPGEGGADKLAVKMGQVATRQPWTVVGIGALVLAGAVFGLTRLVVDTYTIGFLPKDHEVRVDHDRIERTFGKYIPLEFTVEAKAEGGMKEPELLVKVEKLERRFETHPEVGRTTGLPEILMRVNQLWNDERPEAYALATQRGVIAEQMLTYSFSADGRDNLDAIVEPETYKLSHITGRSGLPSANQIASTLSDLKAMAETEIGDAATVKPAGYIPLYVRITRHITEAQVTSALIAFSLITLIMMLLLQSIRLGFLAMLPNVLPTALTLGMMGFFGLRLDVATVLIAAIAIGISVNDTSHIMFRFKHELRLTPTDPLGAIERMMRHAGRPVVMSSLLLIAGFIVLLFASVGSVVMFGVLTSLTVVTALLADLLLTPAILTLVHKQSGK